MRLRGIQIINKSGVLSGSCCGCLLKHNCINQLITKPRVTEGRVLFSAITSSQQESLRKRGLYKFCSVKRVGCLHNHGPIILPSYSAHGMKENLTFPGAVSQTFKWRTWMQWAMNRLNELPSVAFDSYHAGYFHRKVVHRIITASLSVRTIFPLWFTTLSILWHSPSPYMWEVDLYSAGVYRDGKYNGV